MNDSTSPDATTDEPSLSNCDLREADYKETLNSIRHYSNTRFAALTVFLGGTSGLLIVLSRTSEADEPTVPKLLIAFLGLVLSTVFGSMDILVTAYIHRFSKIAEKRYRQGHWHDRPLMGANAHRPAWILYSVFTGVWCWYLVHHLNEIDWLARQWAHFPAPDWSVLTLSLGCFIVLMLVANAFRIRAIKELGDEERQKITAERDKK